MKPRSSRGGTRTRTPRGGRPEISFACSGCKAEVTAAPGEPAACAACGVATALEVPDALRAGAPVEACPACAGQKLYVQRDFNQKAGLAVVIVGAALAPFTPFYSSLIVAALIDAGLYAMLPEITVCYRCHAHFRGFARNPAHEAYDLHLAEQYETHERSGPRPAQGGTRTRPQGGGHA